jgi:hypothetical protein
MFRKNGLIFTTLNDPHWGQVKVARIIPTHQGGEWGEMSDLKDTEWAQFVDTVSQEALDRALRGDSTPLMKEGLRDPKGCLKKAPLPKICADSKRCGSYKETVCKAGHKKMPDCYSVGLDLPPSAQILLMAWHEGYHVVIESD